MHLSILKNFKTMEWDTERERDYHTQLVEVQIRKSLFWKAT